ncbi:hypothetical protein QAD02_006302 [Eretmocerus hayati]|uniref:Uncharacterized protein n=1 Tax=Eretmocerus hayati TaxID=131215 RepID=A0ACC2N0H9_9HYME|nr:hypothetical protein QAD02_006302 [Eretmocerus hayati]
MLKDLIEAAIKVKAQEIFGEKLKYDPQWRGPLAEERVLTDARFLLYFGIFFLLWSALAFYAFTYKELDDVLPEGDGWGGHIRRILEVKYVAVGFISLAALLIILYIILARWFPKFILFTAIVSISGLFIAIVCYCPYAYIMYGFGSVFFLSSLVMAVFCTAQFVILVTNWQEISICSNVIKESSKAILSFPSLFLLPLVEFLLCVVVAFITVSVYKFLTSLDAFYVYLFHIINLLGLIWLWSMLAAFSKMSRFGSYGTWFWTWSKENIPKMTVTRFMGKTLRYHLGTLALGSLVGPPSRFVNFVMRIVDTVKNYKNYPEHLKSEPTNLDRFSHNMDSDAYVMTALHSTDFVNSAEDAFNLQMRNSDNLNVSDVNDTAGFILRSGKILAVSITMLLAWLFCEKDEARNETIYTVLLIGIGCLFVTKSFSTLSRDAVNALFLCVVEDYERNDGSLQRPYYMCPCLRNTLFKK